MEPEIINQLIVVSLLIAINAFFAASEIAIITMPKLRLEQLLDAGDKRAQLIQQLAEESSRFLATMQIGVTLVGFLTAAVVATNLSTSLALALAQLPIDFIATSAQGIAILISTIVLTFIMLIMGNLVPKSVAVQHSEPIAMLVARPLHILTRITSPIARLLISVSNVIARPLGGQPRSTISIVTEEEIKRLVDAGQEGGVIEKDEKEMIYSIFEIGDTVTREVMVPRIDIIALEVSTPPLDAVDVAIKHGYSRIPVFEETIDHIVGILYAKDLLKMLHQQGRVGSRSEHLRDLVRVPYFVPETKKIDVLLEELQQRRVHIVIVIDEYGGTAGLVTLEDLVEEIVGEIQDEYDVSEEPMVRSLGKYEYEIDSRVLLDDVNELLQTELPHEDSDTLGGFIYHQLGKVPSPGEVLEVETVYLKVLHVEDRRIGKVYVRRIDPTAPPSDSRNRDNTAPQTDATASS